MFSLEPIGEDDFAFRYNIYEVAIKPYIDQRVVWDDTQHREKIRSNLAGSGTHFAIGVNGVRIGVAQIEEADDLISLHQIEILPAYQGAGVGTAVVQSLIDESTKTSKDVQLSVFRANTAAQRLYDRLGFRIVSTSEHDVQMRCTPGTDPLHEEGP